MEHGHQTIGADSNVRFLMYQEVVPCPRADNSEVINERLLCLSVLERNLKAGIFRHAGRLIFITGDFAGADNTLGLKMSHPANVVAVNSKGDQRVQGAA
jgi:hypothetical protein